MADGIHQRKHELRATLRVARRTLPVAVAAAESAATARALERLLGALDPPALASYQAAPSELALDAVHDWWWRSGRAILVPRVAAPGILSWHVVAPDTPMVVGAFAIREPAPATLACALPPGVGFGADGRRLGQGGGYYDRVLAQPALRSIGVGFACQRCDDLPVEAHDRAVDGLVLGGVVLRDPRADGAA